MNRWHLSLLNQLYLKDEQFNSIHDSAKQIGGMIFNLITVLSSTDTRTKP